MAMGRSGLFLRLEIIKKLLVVINIAVTWRWGISAMIYGMIVMSCIAYYLNSYYTGKLLSYPIREQLRDMSPYLLVAVLMGAAAYLAGYLSLPPYWLRLLIQVLVGTAIYVFLCRAFHLSAFMELWREGWIRLMALRAGHAA
jgi:hypothetical protein